jgi:glycosyltransferase involved in cell wall biosynthesis
MNASQDDATGIGRQRLSILELNPLRELTSDRANGGVLCARAFLDEVARFTDLTVAGSTPPGAATPYRLEHTFRGGLFRFFSPQSFRRALRLARRTRPDIVTFNFPWLGWIGIALARILGVSAVYRSHNVEFLRLRELGYVWWRLFFVYERWLCRNADLVLTVCHGDERIYRSVFGLRRDSTRTVPPHLDTVFRSADARARARGELCRRLGLDPASTIVLFFGALEYQPNRQALVNLRDEVVPRLRRRGAAFSVIVCGERLEAGLRRSLESLPEFRLLGWVDDLEAVLAGVDLLVSPLSSGGGIKVKCLLALRSGCPVVATRSGARGVATRDWPNLLRVVGNSAWDDFVSALIARPFTAQAPPSPTVVPLETVLSALCPGANGGRRPQGR